MPDFEENTYKQIQEPELPGTLNLSDKLVEPVNEQDN